MEAVTSHVNYSGRALSAPPRASTRCASCARWRSHRRTRAQAYLSTALSFGVVALVFALVDQLLLAVLPLWGEQSIVALYGEGYGPGLLGFAWTLAFNLAIVFLSYALVVLHGRVGKAPFLLGLLAFQPLADIYDGNSTSKNTTEQSE